MNSVRRVVTGFDAEGRSCVISDGPAPQGAGINLWSVDAAAALGRDPGAAGLSLDPAPGVAHWSIVDLPPDAIMREYFKRGIPHHDENGFHCTPTVDFVVIIDGELTLELESGAVVVAAGDCIVQRNTNHAWRNKTGKVVRMMSVMIGARVPQTGAKNNE
jgi:mannose-6-phosphate isomerase-like protein (cupin superfamily)